jgi:8-amino-7-oxononanoate synthase
MQKDYEVQREERGKVHVLNDALLPRSSSLLEERLKVQLEHRIKNSSNRSLRLPVDSHIYITGNINCNDNGNGNINGNGSNKHAIDFSSNDYLGLAHSLAQHQMVQSKYNAYTAKHPPPYLGSSGSRLLSGNSKLAITLENFLAVVHNRPAALICNSGYDANLSLLSSLPRSQDIIVLDELCHNSLIMGVKMSRIPLDRVHYFKHNDIHDLNRILSKVHVHAHVHQEIDHSSSSSMNQNTNIMVVVESVYSMDGDIAPLPQILDMALQFGASVIVDEAHGLGVYGRTNANHATMKVDDDMRMHESKHIVRECAGIHVRVRAHAENKDLKLKSNVQDMNNAPPIPIQYGGTGVLAALELEDHPALLAGVFTFGKAAGCHGAVIIGSQILMDYLVNYARPFIYSTSLPSHSLYSIKCAYETMISQEGEALRSKVFWLVALFRSEMMQALRSHGRDQSFLLPSPSPIQAVICPGNEHCIAVSKKLRVLGGIGVFPIRSPTVPKGGERIRIILHAHNSKEEVLHLVNCLVRLMGNSELVSGSGSGSGVGNDDGGSRLMSRL